jgi:hypothetical protein
MSTHAHGPSFTLADLEDPRRVAEALAHWDELAPELLARLAGHPRYGPQLERLRASERWMQAHAAPERAGSSLSELCPTAEELFDFAGGPGQRPQSSTRHAAIARHVAACASCRYFTTTLVPSAELPADVARALEPAPAARPLPLVLVPRPRHAGRWIPLAAAAALLGFVLVRMADDNGGVAARFPQPPLLRGETQTALAFPRGRVLLPAEELQATWPGWGASLQFEIAPQAEASSYRVLIFRHDGGAFAQRTELARLASPVPQIASTTGALGLGAGHYTWEAWAVVRGLDQLLGTRDFEVQADEALVRELAQLRGESEPQRTLAAVHRLHAHGYATDARELARRMPASPERDAYLGQVPGR